MSQRYPGGLITKTPVVPNVWTAPGVWTLEQALIYQKAGTWPLATDQYFNQTVLLLHGDDAANGAQNNTFLDSSSNNFTITRNGNTTQGTFSPFSLAAGEFSNFFDGSGDYLQLADNAAWDLSGDYTIEMWLYKVTGTSQTFFQLGTSSNILLYQNASNEIIFYSGAAIITASTAASLNTWNHVALVRNGGGTNNTVLYLNGVNVGQATNTTSFTGDASNGVRIGAEYPTGFAFNGYISNVRVTNTAVYTSAFTPSTSPLTAVSGTELLTCQSNRFVDNSTNAFAITRNGDVKVTPFSPFAPTAAYSASVNGGSGYFDGSGDYLQVANNNVFDTNSTFTLEMFVYLNSTANQSFFTRGGGAGSWSVTNGHQFLLFIESGNLYWMWNNAGTPTQITATPPAINQWVHLAVGYDGTTTRFWVNGVSVGSSATGYTLPTTRNIIRIGENPAGGLLVVGYISSLRFVKGTDVYGVSNTNITVPTAPPTAITNTALLTNFTNAGIFDNTGKNNLETVADAQIDTTTKKYGTGSMEFDGNLDRLTIPNDPFFQFGTGDFTIEFWIYVTGNQSVVAGVVSKRGASAVDGTWAIDFASGTTSLRYRILNSSGGVITVTIGTLSTNTWTHIAVSKQSGTTRTYINGVAGGTTSNATAINGSTNPLKIGDGDGTYFTGYLDDIRITKGVARYTANFTPPGGPFQNL